MKKRDKIIYGITIIIVILIAAYLISDYDKGRYIIIPGTNLQTNLPNNTYSIEKQNETINIMKGKEKFAALLVYDEGYTIEDLVMKGKVNAIRIESLDSYIYFGGVLPDLTYILEHKKPVVIAFNIKYKEEILKFFEGIKEV